MFQYLDGVARDFPDAISGKATLPAADYLFKNREGEHDKHLSEEEAMIFHHTVAHLLFLSIQARQDIQMAMSFLTTRRFKKPDNDDWGKLKRLLTYLKCTRCLKLTLTKECLDVIK